MGKLLLSIIIFIISNNSLAIVFGGSNLGMFGYSSHDCSKPYRPYQFNSHALQMVIRIIYYKIKNLKIAVSFYEQIIDRIS